VIGSTLVACLPPPPPPTWPTATGSSIAAGQQLPPGASIRSPDGHYRVVMQGDGNLVEYVGSRALWHTNTDGHPGAVARMQSDGNLVVYDTNMTALWSAGTGGRTGTFRADLQNDANFIVYSGSTAIWSSRTTNAKLASGEGLDPGQLIWSANRAYRLVMQGDGNLVEYQGGTALWSSRTNGFPGAYVRMQTDGNLVVYLGTTAKWASGTVGHAGAWLSLQDDGNLVVRSAGGTALWARFGLDPEPATKTASLGMPFSGKWAYNVPVAGPPWSDATSSHPAVHKISGGADWATDLYAGTGTAVKLQVSNVTGGTLSFSWKSTSTSCGTSTGINIFIGGTLVGWVYFAHLNGAVTSGAITNGMTLGTVGNFGCNPGPHVHVELKSTVDFACYANLGTPGAATISTGTVIGKTGVTSASGIQQACS
jgi:hypothetical protein